MRAFALFLTDIKVSNAPLQSGLEVIKEVYGYFTDIAFNTHFNDPTLKVLALKDEYAT